MDHRHPITSAKAIEYKVGWEEGVLTSRVEHWVRKGMVRKNITLWEAQRVYEEAIAAASCSWCFTKKQRKNNWYRCPKCDSGELGWTM